MNKWTPGPWVCQGQTVYAFNEKGHNLFFAHVMDVHTSRHELIANAHLISAAPELYEALATLTDFPDDYFEGEEDGPFTMTARLSVMRKARAVLAKARGEA